MCSHSLIFVWLTRHQMPDEEAFCLLVRLMHSYDLRGHFLPEMPKLQQRMVRTSLLPHCVIRHAHSFSSSRYLRLFSGVSVPLTLASLIAW